MSAPLKVSAELSASIRRMKARTWLDADAGAFEQGAIPTRAASKGVRPLKASRFAPRPARLRLTDEERIKRRRRKRQLGGSSALPDTLRQDYTEGERSVLCVVSGEVRRCCATRVAWRGSIA